MSEEQQPHRHPAESITRKPTSFLSLPRELRQKILFEASEPNYLDEPYEIGYRWESLKIHVQPFRHVNPQLKPDIDYVEKSWAKRIFKWEREEIGDEEIGDGVLGYGGRLSSQLLWCEEAMLA